MKYFSFGGGVQSTACLVLASQRKIHYQKFLFANVGAKAENPLSLKYIEEVSKPFAAKHNLEIIEVQKRDRHGNPVDLYEHLHRPIRSIDIPLRMPGGGFGNRKCTAEFKIEVVAKHLKSLNQEGLILGKGISTDEISRARTDSGFDFYTVEYPLINLGLSRQDCRKIISDAGLPECPKSSCWFCPFKKPSEWQAMKREQPELFWQAVGLEKMLHSKRETLGKDRLYLTEKGAKYGTTLDEVIPDQMDLFLDDWDGMEMCESGFCWT